MLLQVRECLDNDNTDFSIKWNDKDERSKVLKTPVNSGTLSTGGK